MADRSCRFLGPWVTLKASKAGYEESLFRRILITLRSATSLHMDKCVARFVSDSWVSCSIQLWTRLQLVFDSRCGISCKSQFSYSNLLNGKPSLQTKVALARKFVQKNKIRELRKISRITTAVRKRNMLCMIVTHDQNILLSQQIMLIIIKWLTNRLIDTITFG